MGADLETKKGPAAATLPKPTERDTGALEQANVPQVDPAKMALGFAHQAAFHYNKDRYWAARDMFQAALENVPEENKALKARIKLGVAQGHEKTNEWEVGRPMAVEAMKELLQHGNLNKDERDLLKIYINKDKQWEFKPSDLESVNEAFGFLNPEYAINPEARPKVHVPSNLRNKYLPAGSE